MDLDFTSGARSMYIRDTIGVARLNGAYVELNNFEGDATIDATGSVNAEIYPYEEGLVDIRSNGDCTVYLPEFAPLVIEIEFDPEQESAFTDLGFDDVFLADGLYTATRMPGDIVVNIRCPSGQVDLRAHPLSW